jgi:hypothetical protein
MKRLNDASQFGSVLIPCTEGFDEALKILFLQIFPRIFQERLLRRSESGSGKKLLKASWARPRVQRPNFSCNYDDDNVGSYDDCPDVIDKDEWDNYSESRN